jgi:C4-dicarboxylate-specific signal transduction histidine kinase
MLESFLLRHIHFLRLFLRLDESEIKPIDIYGGIDSTLMILQSRGLKPMLIAMRAKLSNVECFAGLLNQVFMNLLVNVIDTLIKFIETSAIQISTECRGDRSMMLEGAED